MGKKNKDSYWGIDDAQTAADAFFAFEKGEGDLLPGMEKAPKKKKNKMKELDQVIADDLFGDQSEGDNYWDTDDTDQSFDTSDYVDYDSVITNDTDDYNIDDDVHLTIDKFKSTDEDELDASSLSLIGVDVFPSVKRVVVDDLYAPTAFCYSDEFILDTYINYDGYNDPTETAAMTSKIIERIIALKHPSAIFTHEQFAKEFGGVTSYSSVIFNFYKTDKYVFAYIVDAESFNDLNLAIEKECEQISDILDFYVSLAYAAGRSDQVFFYDNEEYVRKLFDHMTARDVQDMFVQLFKCDSQTVIGTDIGDFDYTCGVMKIEDHQSILDESAAIMLKVIDEDEMKEEDDEDDNEGDEVILSDSESDITDKKPDEKVDNSPSLKLESDSSEPVKPADEVENNTSDDEDLELSIEDAEEVELPKKPEVKPIEQRTIKPVTPSDNSDESMVIPVIRKGGK